MNEKGNGYILSRFISLIVPVPFSSKILDASSNKMKKIVFIFVFLFMAFMPCAYSQPPTPSEGYASQSQKNKTSHNQGETNTTQAGINPLSKNVALVKEPDHLSDHKRNDDQNDPAEERWTDWGITFATIVIAIFTGAPGIPLTFSGRLPSNNPKTRKSPSRRLK